MVHYISYNKFFFTVISIDKHIVPKKHVSINTNYRIPLNSNYIDVSNNKRMVTGRIMFSQLLVSSINIGKFYGGAP